MTLVVRAPRRRESERRYILDVVLSGFLGLDWRLTEEDRPDVLIHPAEEPDGAGVSVPDTLFATEDHRWLTDASLPATPLPWLPVGDAASDVLDPHERLPVVYGATGGDAGRLVEADERGVRLNVDVFGSAFALLTRYEEVVDGPRDGYGRFPASASLASREGFLDVPIVDVYVELLSAALRRVRPRLAPRRWGYRLHLTHDVDDPLCTAGRGPLELARQFGGDVVRRRDPDLLYRRARALVAVRRGDHEPDPHNTFDFLMRVSERHSLRSAFFFLADNRPDPPPGAAALFEHPWVRGLVGRVHRNGHEVGFHAGFGTYRDPQRTAEQFGRLREIAAAEGVEQPRWGGRQHYLQWSNPVTWRNWSEAGLDYDCTLGFSEQIGFRTGTAREYPVFDLVQRRALDLRELPFQVMDTTLFRHMDLAPDDAHERVLRIARACGRLGGTLGVLWHNDEVLRTSAEKRWYSELVEAVARPA